MHLLSIFWFLFVIIVYANAEDRKLSKNASLTFDTSGNNFIDTIQNLTGDKEASLESVDSFELPNGDSSSTSPSAFNQTKGTKYPILIPNVNPEDIDEDDEEHAVYLHDDYQGTEEIENSENFERISTSKYLKRDCGLRENCYSEGLNGRFKRPEIIDFMREPFYCRCDEGICDTYGDCCSTVANVSNLLPNNPWRCQQVQHEMIWALMISKCRNPDDPNRLNCENPDLIPEKRQSYQHDVPVYNNVSKILYRNIFCAQCNSVPPEELYNMELQIMCSENITTTTEREAFISNAMYEPRKRLWTDGRTICEIYAPELDQYRVSQLIPEIRFCRKDAIDFCPKDFALRDPIVDTLCHSYTQYVKHRYGTVFKNPHCAHCHGIEAMKELRCVHDQAYFSMFDSKISPAAAGASLGSAGLSIIFDFNLGRDGEGYVGYDMKCTGNRIWDFLRQKCSHIECPEGQRLDESDGTCQYHYDPNQTVNPTVVTEKSENNVTTPTNRPHPSNPCYILLIHQHEYTLLENKSVLVNQTSFTDSNKNPNMKEVDTVIFHPGAYKFWNATTLSICAKNLTLGFRERFSPILNYLSLTALGISVFFSALHLLIFFILPKMRNLPGKNLFCLTISLLTSQLLLLTLIQNQKKIICLVASMSMHYLFLASFFWMNIMSFDIWRTFSTEFMTRRQSSNNTRTFIKYSLFAWLMPALIVLLASVTEFGLAEEFGETWPILIRIRPLYGHNDLCWISQGLSLFIFFAVPVLVIICFNIILFTLTTKAIMDKSQDVFFRGNGGGSRKHSKCQGIIKSKGQLNGKFCNGDNSSGEEIDRMKLYVKLGLIMGITWILGFISGMSGLDWLWYPFVILNGLQGTFIFFAFDFKIKVWQMFKERLDRDGNVMGGLKAGMSIRDTTNSTFGSNSPPPSQIGSISKLSGNRLDV